MGQRAKGMGHRAEGKGQRAEVGKDAKKKESGGAEEKRSTKIEVTRLGS
jgi:hypothetical protein